MGGWSTNINITMNRVSCATLATVLQNDRSWLPSVTNCQYLRKAPHFTSTQYQVQHCRRRSLTHCSVWAS